MAVTPLVATYRASIDYTTDGLSHRCDLLCSCTPGAGTSGFDAITFAADSLDMQSAVDQWVLLAKAILPTGGLIDAWTLYHRVGGVYNPVYSNTIGVAGTNGASRSVGNQFTLVYRDLSFVRVRNVLLGVAGGAPQHAPMGTLAGGAFGNYALDFVNRGIGHLGDWVTGRGGVYLNTGINYTVSLNRKSRRRLGLV